MDTNETAVEYIARVRNLAHQVKSSDKNDYEITIITKILGTLQTKNNFWQAWLLLDENRQNLQTLTARLIDEKTNLKKNDRFYPLSEMNQHLLQITRHLGYQRAEAKKR